MRFLVIFALAASPAWGAPKTVRIGVFVLFHAQELVLRPAGSQALLLEDRGKNPVLEGVESARFRLSAGRVECFAQGVAWSADSIRIAAREGTAADFLLSVPGKIERRFRGTLEVRAGARELAAVVTMDRGVAVASVVAAESAPGAGLEALKAQAVVALSYYAGSRARHAGYDFCDTTHCQFLREPPAPGEAASLAAAETRGLLLAYRGVPVAALYSASCGGRTRSLAGPAAGEYPYFSVKCSYCLLRAGRGAGHGLGLCQVGAAAMAAEGAAFTEILGRYYPNTTLMEETQ